MTEAEFYAQQDREDDLRLRHREKMEEVLHDIETDPVLAWEILVEEDYKKDAREEIVRAVKQTSAFKAAAKAYAIRLADRHCDALEAARKEGERD